MAQARYQSVTIAALSPYSSTLQLNAGETVLGVEMDTVWTAADVQLRVARNSALVQNRITNGGFETNTAGWTTNGTDTIASSGLQFTFGTKSCLVTYQDNVTLMDYSAAAITNEPYTVSAYVRIPTNYDGGGIALKQLNFTVAASQAAADMSKRDVWQRLTLTFTPGVDVTGNFQIINTGAAPTAGRTINVDGAQLELGSTANTYVETDGGVSPSPFLPAFDSAGSLSANTYKIVNPAVSTLHFFGTNALPNALLFVPIGGLQVRLHSVTTTLLTDVPQAAACTLQVLIGTAV